MKKRRMVFLWIGMILSTLACILQMEGPSSLSQEQVDTLAAQTMAFLQYQTYVAMGTQALPPPADTAAPPPGADTPTNTVMPSVTPTGTQQPTVTPTAVPCNWVQFISDVTIPDNWETGPLDHFTKTWRLKNIGSCTWTSGYDLVFDHGDQMDAPASQQLTAGTVAPGGTIDVSVDLLSPDTPGTYQGFFKLRASDSSVFGIGEDADTAFWVKIVVTAAAAPVIQQVSSSTTIHSGSTGSTTAYCPAGSVVTGGGFSFSNGSLIYTQAKNGNGWTVVAKNNAGSDRTLTVYAECLTYPSASTDMVEDHITVSAHSSGIKAAACPAGSVVTGGGFTSSPDGNMWVFRNWQHDNSWEVGETNNSGVSKSFHVYAVCLSGTPFTTVRQDNTGTIPGGSYGQVKAECPVGRVTSAGGWGLSSDELPYYSAFSSGAWRVYVRNDGVSARSLLTSVTCLG